MPRNAEFEERLKMTRHATMTFNRRTERVSITSVDRILGTMHVQCSDSLVYGFNLNSLIEGRNIKLLPNVETSNLAADAEHLDPTALERCLRRKSKQDHRARRVEWASQIIYGYLAAHLFKVRERKHWCAMLIVSAVRVVASKNVTKKKRDIHRTSNLNKRLISIGEALARLHLGKTAYGNLNNYEADIIIPAVLERAVQLLEVADSLIAHLSFPVATLLSPEETKMIKKLENDSALRLQHESEDRDIKNSHRDILNSLTRVATQCGRACNRIFASFCQVHSMFETDIEELSIGSRPKISLASDRSSIIHNNALLPVITFLAESFSPYIQTSAYKERVLHCVPPMIHSLVRLNSPFGPPSPFVNRCESILRTKLSNNEQIAFNTIRYFFQFL